MTKEDKIKNLLTGLGEDETAEVTIIEDPIEDMRRAIAGFINQKFDRLKDESDFVVFLREAIKAKVELGEASFSDIATMLNQTKMRETDAVESLLQFFKPAANAESSILSPSKKEEGDGYDIDHKSMKTLDLLRRMLEQVEKDKGSKETID